MAVHCPEYCDVIYNFLHLCNLELNLAFCIAVLVLAHKNVAKTTTCDAMAILIFGDIVSNHFSE